MFAVFFNEIANVSDLQRMFPTPPSLESCHAFSPEGRPLHPPSYTQTSHESEALKREVIKSEPGLAEHPVAGHDPPSVLDVSKAPSHPMSDFYQPLSHLSQLPAHHTYTPSWMVSITALYQVTAFASVLLISGFV